MNKSRSSRWLLRYSLRTMLIVVTICALWLGVSRIRIRARGEAIRAIDRNGGTYGVRTVGPKWLRRLIGDDKCFYDAIRVSFGPDNFGYDPQNPFEDHDLAAMIDYLNVFERFSELDLSHSDITDAGLIHLQRLRNIETLQLDGTKVTDHGLLYLAGLATLREVRLRDTKVTKEGIARLQSALPNCTIEQ